MFGQRTWQTGEPADGIRHDPLLPILWTDEKMLNSSSEAREPCRAQGFLEISSGEEEHNVSSMQAPHSTGLRGHSTAVTKPERNNPRAASVYGSDVDSKKRQSRHIEYDPEKIGWIPRKRALQKCPSHLMENHGNASGSSSSRGSRKALWPLRDMQLAPDAGAGEGREATSSADCPARGAPPPPVAPARAPHLRR